MSSLSKQLQPKEKLAGPKLHVHTSDPLRQISQFIGNFIFFPLLILPGIFKAITVISNDKYGNVPVILNNSIIESSTEYDPSSQSTTKLLLFGVYIIKQQYVLQFIIKLLITQFHT